MEKKRSNVNRERKEKFWDVKMKGENVEEERMEDEEEDKGLPEHLKRVKNEVEITNKGPKTVISKRQSTFEPFLTLFLNILKKDVHLQCFCISLAWNRQQFQHEGLQEEFLSKDHFHGTRREEGEQNDF